MTNYYKYLRSQGKDEEVKTELNKVLEIFEKAIEKRGAYFGGNLVFCTRKNKLFIIKQQLSWNGSSFMI